MSGSQNAHAPKPPSGAKRWMSCTASIRREAEMKDEIFLSDYQKVVNLVPYLKSFPKEEWSDDEHTAVEIVDSREPGDDPLDLSDEDRQAITNSAGNEYTREGTRAHDFSEKILRSYFFGDMDFTVEGIPEDFQQPVGVYVDECIRLAEANPGCDIYIEEKVPLFYDSDHRGTVDFAIVTTDGRVIVLDLKYGQGVAVSPEENPQLAIYGESLILDLEDEYDFDPGNAIHIGICHPRHHGVAPIRYWETTVADLHSFCEDIQDASDAIDDGAGEFAPSEDACRWCELPIRATCRPRLDALEAGVPGEDMRAMLDLLPDLSKRGATPKHNKKSASERLADVLGRLEDEDLLHLFAHTKQWSQFLKDVADYCEERYLQGDPIDGTKMVDGRQGNSAWNDPEEAGKTLANQKLKEKERYNFTLISPTQALKVLGDKVIEKKPTYSPRLHNKLKSLISRSAGKPSLTLEEDPRPAITVGVSALPPVAEDIK